MKPVDFSVMSHDEAVMRLEKLQAVLAEMAKECKSRLRSGELQGISAASIGFRDGSLHSICSCLDVVQGREIGSNLRDLMKVQEPCTDPLFV